MREEHERRRASAKKVIVFATNRHTARVTELVLLDEVLLARIVTDCRYGQAPTGKRSCITNVCQMSSRFPQRRADPPETEEDQARQSPQ